MTIDGILARKIGRIGSFTAIHFDKCKYPKLIIIVISPPVYRGVVAPLTFHQIIQKDICIQASKRCYQMLKVYPKKS